MHGGEKMELECGGGETGEALGPATPWRWGGTEEPQAGTEEVHDGTGWMEYEEEEEEEQTGLGASVSQT